MVAAVAELHRDIDKRRPSARLSTTQKQRAVPLQDCLVAALLVLGHVNVDERLLDRLQTELHIPLLAPKQVRSQSLAERLHLLGRLHVPVALEKPLHRREGLRVEKVEQREELGHVILQRRAGQHQLVRAVELVEDAQYPGMQVLEAVALVDDEILPPTDLAKRVGRGNQRLIGRDADVEAHRPADLPPAATFAAAHDPFVLENHIACLLVAVEHHRVQERPRLHLALPVLQRRQRDDDQEWPVHAVERPQALQQRRGLGGLAEPHFVAKNDRAAVQIVAPKPAQPLTLVVSQLLPIA
mmetsp:Transcript_63615/g.189617  ORF Transcript_63615/g.189617 Transcript_63615/m.189617 type:complete len:298 (-) Transcript_63615:147-1040(-)